MPRMWRLGARPGGRASHADAWTMTVSVFSKYCASSAVISQTVLPFSTFTRRKFWMCCATFGRKSAPRSAERARAALSAMLRDTCVADAREGERDHDEQTGAQPCPSHALIRRDGTSVPRAPRGVKVESALTRPALRQRSCHHTHSAGARRICASIAAVRSAVSAVTRCRPPRRHRSARARNG